MDNAKTGALIAARRKELGLTQKELSELLHISDRTVSKWERGAGFPDVSLLEPLADALDLSILDLIQGEQQEEAVTEVTLRSVIASIGQHVRKTTRQQLVSAAAQVFLLAMSAFILFAIADSTGLLSKEVYLEVPLGIYEDGILVEETTVIIDGERHRLTGDYFGRFAIAAIEETCREGVNATVRWNSKGKGCHEIFYSRPGQTWIDGPISRTELYISDDMRVLARRMDDGRILSTHEHLVALAILEHYYATDNLNTIYHRST